MAVKLNIVQLILDSRCGCLFQMFDFIFEPIIKLEIGIV